MAVIAMHIDDIVKYDSVDYEHCFEYFTCPSCTGEFQNADLCDQGEYVAYHMGVPCKATFDFTTLDILMWKRRDASYPDILRSVKEDDSLPIARVNAYQITDGHHRLTAALQLGKQTILVDDNVDHCADDSGVWMYGDPIETYATEMEAYA